MSRFAETSFLLALYFPSASSERATESLGAITEPLLLSPLVRFEFEQAVWLEVFRREHGEQQCISHDLALSGLAAFEIHSEQDRFRFIEVDFVSLLQEAGRLTNMYTLRHGIRAMDLLHLAAATLLGCSGFLTFDLRQRKVAELEGFEVPF